MNTNRPGDSQPKRRRLQENQNVKPEEYKQKKQSTISTVPLDKNAKKKQSKRTEAFQRIIKNDVSGEIETDMKLVKRGKNVIQKMESASNGPLSVLHECMKNGIKAKIWVRRYNGLRGCLTGYIAAFDNHMNLALIDVDEVYTLETWMTGHPLKKYQKKVLKKREEKRQEREFSTMVEHVNMVKCETPKEKGVEDYLKKLTESIKQKSTVSTAISLLSAPKNDDAQFGKCDEHRTSDFQKYKDNKEILDCEKQKIKLQEDCPARDNKSSETVNSQDIWSILTKIDFQSLLSNDKTEQHSIPKPSVHEVKATPLLQPHKHPNLTDSKGRFHKIPLIIDSKPCTTISSVLKLDPNSPDPRLRPRVKNDSTRMLKDGNLFENKKKTHVKEINKKVHASLKYDKPVIDRETVLQKPSPMVLDSDNTSNICKAGKDRSALSLSKEIIPVAKELSSGFHKARNKFSDEAILNQPFLMVKSKPGEAGINFDEKTFLDRPLPMELDLALSLDDDNNVSTSSKPTLKREDINHLSKDTKQRKKLKPTTAEVSSTVQSESAFLSQHGIYLGRDKIIGKPASSDVANKEIELNKLLVQERTLFEDKNSKTSTIIREHSDGEIDKAKLSETTETGKTSFQDKNNTEMHESDIETINSSERERLVVSCAKSQEVKVESLTIVNEDLRLKDEDVIYAIKKTEATVTRLVPNMEDVSNLERTKKTELSDVLNEKERGEFKRKHDKLRYVNDCKRTIEAGTMEMATQETIDTNVHNEKNKSQVISKNENIINSAKDNEYEMKLRENSSAYDEERSRATSGNEKGQEQDVSMGQEFEGSRASETNTNKPDLLLGQPTEITTKTKTKKKKKKKKLSFDSIQNILNSVHHLHQNEDCSSSAMDTDANAAMVGFGNGASKSEYESIGDNEDKTNDKSSSCAGTHVVEGGEEDPEKDKSADHRKGELTSIKTKDGANNFEPPLFNNSKDLRADAATEAENESMDIDIYSDIDTSTVQGIFDLNENLSCDLSGKVSLASPEGHGLGRSCVITVELEVEDGTGSQKQTDDIDSVFNSNENNQPLNLKTSSDSLHESSERQGLEGRHFNAAQRQSGIGPVVDSLINNELSTTSSRSEPLCKASSGMERLFQDKKKSTNSERQSVKILLQVKERDKNIETTVQTNELTQATDQSNKPNQATTDQSNKPTGITDQSNKPTDQSNEPNKTEIEVSESKVREHVIEDSASGTITETEVTESEGKRVMEFSGSSDLPETEVGKLLTKRAPLDESKVAISITKDVLEISHHRGNLKNKINNDSGTKYVSDAKEKTQCQFFFHSIAGRLNSLKKPRRQGKLISRLESRFQKSDVKNVTPLFETPGMKSELSSSETEASPVKKPSSSVSTAQSKKVLPSMELTDAKSGINEKVQLPMELAETKPMQTPRKDDIGFITSERKSCDANERISLEGSCKRTTISETKTHFKDSTGSIWDKSLDMNESNPLEDSYEAANTLLLLATSRPGSPGSDTEMKSENVKEQEIKELDETKKIPSLPATWQQKDDFSMQEQPGVDNTGSLGGVIEVKRDGVRKSGIEKWDSQSLVKPLKGKQSKVGFSIDEQLGVNLNSSETRNATKGLIVVSKMEQHDSSKTQEEPKKTYKNEFSMNEQPGVSLGDKTRNEIEIEQESRSVKKCVDSKTLGSHTTTKSIPHHSEDIGLQKTDLCQETNSSKTSSTIRCQPDKTDKNPIKSDKTDTCLNVDLSASAAKGIVTRHTKTDLSNSDSVKTGCVSNSDLDDLDDKIVTRNTKSNSENSVTCSKTDPDDDDIYKDINIDSLYGAFNFDTNSQQHTENTVTSLISFTHALDKNCPVSSSESVAVEIEKEGNRHDVTKGVAVEIKKEGNHHDVAKSVAVKIKKERNHHDVTKGVAVEIKKEGNHHDVAKSVAVKIKKEGNHHDVTKDQIDKSLDTEERQCSTIDEKNQLEEGEVLDSEPESHDGDVDVKHVTKSSTNHKETKKNEDDAKERSTTTKSKNASTRGSTHKLEREFDIRQKLIRSRNERTHQQTPSQDVKAVKLRDSDDKRKNSNITQKMEHSGSSTFDRDHHHKDDKPREERTAEHSGSATFDRDRHHKDDKPREERTAGHSGSATFDRDRHQKDDKPREERTEKSQIFKVAKSSQGVVNDLRDKLSGRLRGDHPKVDVRSRKEKYFIKHDAFDREEDADLEGRYHTSRHYPRDEKTNKGHKLTEEGPSSKPEHDNRQHERSTGDEDQKLSSRHHLHERAKEKQKPEADVTSKHEHRHHRSTKNGESFKDNRFSSKYHSDSKGIKKKQKLTGEDKTSKQYQRSSGTRGTQKLEEVKEFAHDYDYNDQHREKKRPEEEAVTSAEMTTNYQRSKRLGVEFDKEKLVLTGKIDSHKESKNKWQPDVKPPLDRKSRPASPSLYHDLKKETPLDRKGRSTSPSPYDYDLGRKTPSHRKGRSASPSPYINDMGRKTPTDRKSRPASPSLYAHNSGRNMPPEGKGRSASPSPYTIESGRKTPSDCKALPTSPSSYVRYDSGRKTPSNLKDRPSSPSLHAHESSKNETEGQHTKDRMKEKFLELQRKTMHKKLKINAKSSSSVVYEKSQTTDAKITLSRTNTQDGIPIEGLSAPAKIVVDQEPLKNQEITSANCNDAKKCDDFDSNKMLACVTKLYEANIVTTSQSVGDEIDDENEAERRGKENESRQERELNIFQKRKQKDNEHFLKTRVKRTYGWIERCEQTDKANAASSTASGKVESKNTSRRVDLPIGEDTGSQNSEGSGFLPDSKIGEMVEHNSKTGGIGEAQRQMWRDEAHRRRQRELINKVRGVTFTPSIEGRVTTKGVIYKRRHVNQLFVRGDNVVLVAFDRPETG